MFEMLMLLGFFLIGFSHLLPPSNPQSESGKQSTETTQATRRRHPRGQRPMAKQWGKRPSAFRREGRSVPDALGKTRRLC